MLQLATPYPYVAILLVGIVAAWVAFHLYKREREAVPRFWGRLLVGLRIAAILLLAFILAEPILSFQRTLFEKAMVIVLLDTSQSMTTKDASATASEKLDTLVALGKLEASGRVLKNQRYADAASKAKDRLRELRKLIGAGAKREELERAVDELAKDAKELGDATLRQELSEGIGAALFRAFDDPKRQSRLDDLAIRLKGIEARLEAEVKAQLEEQDKADRKVLTPDVEKNFDELDRLGIVKALIAKAGLRDRFDVKYLAFDEVVRPVKDGQLGSLRAEGKFTDLAQVLKEVGGRYDPVRLAGIVLVSDGRITRGRTPENEVAILASRGVAVYTVGVGTTNPPRDIVVENVRAPASALAGDTIDADVSIKAAAYAGKELNFELAKDGVVVKGKVLTAPPDGMIFERVNFRLTDTGKQTYEARITPMPDEIRTDNNSKTFTVDVRKDKLKVLYFDGRPRWEFRYLKNAFERDQSIEIRWELLKEGQPFPTKKHELYNYDAVVIGDVPMTSLLPSDVGNLQKFVSEYGGSLVVVAGDRWMPSAYREGGLEELLPVQLADAPLPAVLERTKREGFRAMPTDEGRESPITRLLDDPEQNRKLWEKLPKFYWHAFAPSVKPGAVAILDTTQVFGEKEERYIILAHHYYGIGKVVFVGSDEFWRWRWKVGDRFFHRLWSQILRWCAMMGPTSADKCVRLSMEKSNYEVGESPVIQATVKDENGIPLNDARALLRLKGKKENSYAFQYIQGSEGRYNCRLKDLEPGSYEASAIITGVSEDKDESSRATLRFSVLAPVSQELVRTEMDRELLQKIAYETGGKYLPIWELPSISKEFKKQNVERIERTQKDLWSSYWLLIPFVLILAAEWTIRKMRGLM